MLQFTGLHHVSAITKSAQQNLDFYTNVLGFRLVKKTVNQDSPSMYHLFYADGEGSPGTEMTFFEIPVVGQTHEGTNSISTTSFRVPTDEALHFWKERFEQFDVAHEDITERAGRQTLRFRDSEKQRLMLVSDEHDEGVAGGIPWKVADIPESFAIYGLGPSYFTVANAKATDALLTTVLHFREAGTYEADGTSYKVYETGEGGSGAEIHVEHREDLPVERAGRGSVHHIALRVSTEEDIYAWIERLEQFGVRNSGFVDRFYFKSIYMQDPNGLTIEIASDGPGFAIDEPEDTLGEALSLPPFLENDRAVIEANLKPLHTKRGE